MTAVFLTAREEATRDCASEYRLAAPCQPRCLPQWVRRGSDPKSVAEMHTFSGRTIDVPSMFIGGKSDWGVYQTPGAAESMQKTACTRMVDFHLVDGAGHWVQQEQPEKVTQLLTKFLQDQSPRDGHKR